METILYFKGKRGSNVNYVPFDKVLMVSEYSDSLDVLLSGDSSKTIRFKDGNDKNAQLNNYLNYLNSKHTNQNQIKL